MKILAVSHSREPGRFVSASRADALCGPRPARADSLGGRGFSRDIGSRRQAISAAQPHPQQVAFPAAPAPEQPVTAELAQPPVCQIKWDTVPLNPRSISLKTKKSGTKEVGHSCRFRSVAVSHRTRPRARSIDLGDAPEEDRGGVITQREAEQSICLDF